MKLSIIWATLWVIGWVIAGIAVIYLAFIRCPKCRGYHTDSDEQDNCKRE